MSKLYPQTAERINHVTGIDTSDLFVAKTGVRGANDLVWVGRAANYAAKLTALPPAYPTYITKEVYDALANDGGYQMVGNYGGNLPDGTHLTIGLSTGLVGLGRLNDSHSIGTSSLHIRPSRIFLH
jgi:hypothetical protein